MTEIIQTIGEPVVGILILVGAILSAISSFGIIRLPDVYLRAHAATKSATLAVLFVLVGAFLYFLWFAEYTSARLLLGIVFVFITAPVAGHLLGRAAYRRGVPLWKKSILDELKEAHLSEEHAEMAEAAGEARAAMVEQKLKEQMKLRRRSGSNG
ncbi:monovalent cation/H(+) antiporter subunit G [Paenibacillus senegalensis]|uniref:monovalent cation/H(+) antiporter subunit G n=1 Tax=Paenibacillus senegalensis TaxID=1465766 RepID=UPI000288B785|nr:monovalent cation/H(+) antiporter subunit G [Paenibacillus senegalensis]